MKPQTLQNDPDVKLPAAVRAAAARSLELQNAYMGETQEVTAESNPELAASTLTAEAPAQEAPAQEAPVQPQPKAETGDDESWEHKYKSVHGRYVRSQEQIKQLTDQVTSLQNVMASIQAGAPASPMPEFKAERLITEEETRDYGEDFLAVVGKKAKEEIGPIIQGYEAKIKEMEQKLQGVHGVVAQDNHAKLMTTLDERLPTWRDLNTNDDFLDWLRLPDPYSGAIRHEMLKAAYAQSNASRVLAFFNGFLAEEAAVAPAQAEPDARTTTVPKVPLQNLAAPGRAKTAASASAPAEKPIFTRAQIAAFYADVAAGKFRGKDDMKNKMEASIFEAQREGRIR